MSESNSENSIGRAFLNQYIRRVDVCVRSIKHCVDQLSDEQVWWRPHDGMNSIGNLLLHVCGNMTQWVLCILREQTDTRNRPQEFAERGPIPKQKLIALLEKTTNEVKQSLADAPVESLLNSHRIQGMEETALSAISESVNHLAGHTQEIICMTRIQLGDDYKFAWQPKTKEEGADVA